MEEDRRQQLGDGCKMKDVVSAQRNQSAEGGKKRTETDHTFQKPLCSDIWQRVIKKARYKERRQRISKKKKASWTRRERWSDGESKSDCGRKRARELKRWLDCSLRARIWLATASQRASCCSKQPLDKCEIGFLSHLTAAQITSAPSLHSPHERTWRWISFTGWALQHSRVLTWHSCRPKSCAERNGCTVVKMLTAG